MNNVNMLQKSFCTGCGLCESVCPVHAIKMAENGEGFVFPIVTDKCIHCGLCAKKCPIISQSYCFNEQAEQCFAMQASDDVREKSSSGGVFFEIANDTIKKGGVVCAAAFNKEQDVLQHVIVDKKEDIDKLLKSKYVKSSTRFVFEKVKAEVDKGKTAVFCGCPCQVAAMKQFLGSENEKLVTIDLLCHGAPSPLAYKHFLAEKNSQHKQIKKVDFRDKRKGWGTNLTIEYEDNTSVEEEYNGTYFRAFLSGLNMMESCYSCPWSAKRRTGDITLGDFWGVEKYNPAWNDKKGTSLVLCNTKKGSDCIEKIKRKLKLAEELSFHDMFETSKEINWALHTPTPKNSMRKCFFRHLKKDGFYKATRYAERAIMDVGIVGWWVQNNRSNYGSTLTDYALGKYLESLGHSVAFISPPNFDRQYAGDFNKRYNYRMTAKYSYDDMKENNKYIDSFVVASDVLWFYDAMIQTGYTHMLDFVDDNKKKIAYSASFGKIDKFIPKEEQPRVKYLLSRFDFISMREEQGVEILRDKFNIPSVRMLDPVFLCDIGEWDKIIANATTKPEGDFVFAYLMDPTPQKAADIKEFAKRCGCKVAAIPDRQDNYEEKKKILKDCGLIDNATLEDYLYAFKNAKYVITDSFHGMCFSIIFRKSFYALVNRARGASRFESLATLFGLSNRLIESTAEIRNLSRENSELNYLTVEKYIEEEIEKSKEWLNSALSDPKKDIAIDRCTLLENEFYLLKKRINL